MKSTDTILGAFGVMGILLLGVVVASSIDTAEVEVDPSVTDNETEVALESDPEELLPAQEEVKSNETVLGESNNNFDITRWQDYGITNQELLALVDSNDNNLALNDVDESVLVELEQLLNSNLQETRLDFKQQNSDEVVLSESSNEAVETNVDDNQVNQESVEVEVNTADNEDQLAVEDDVAEPTDRPSRVTSLFDRLFGDSDNVDVGGTLEGGSDDQVLSTDSHVVESGDNIWDILTTDYGLTNAEAAGVINQMQLDPESFGVTSGSVDLIYPGQVINFGGLGL